MCVGLMQSAARGQENAFKVCDNTSLYRIDDTMLAEKGFSDAKLVETNPQFTGKVEALQKFFDANLKLGEEAKNVFVRVHIKFVVDCKGKVGDFSILSPAAPELAKQVLAVAQKMPDWEAGKVKGASVDVIDKLAFTISGGKAKVSYK